MTTDVGHGRKRRSRGSCAKRRTPRVAIAAGALAAASIPLWPSPANATTYYDEYKLETYTRNSLCAIEVESSRSGEHVRAVTRLQGWCGDPQFGLTVNYVPLGGGAVKQVRGSSNGGTAVFVEADGVRDLISSVHWQWWGFLDGAEYTLNHPK